MKWSIDRIKDKVRPHLERWMRLRRGDRKLSLKSWMAHIEVGNFLASVSTTGLMALGVVPMSLNILIALAIFLVFLGVVGRYIDSVEDDMERLIKYEQHLSQSAYGFLPSDARVDDLQSQSNQTKEP